MTYDVVIFGLSLKINPIAFTLPIGSGWDIYWYGIIIALGFLGAIVYAMLAAKRFEMDTDRMLDVVLVTTPVAILCARAYYCIFGGVKIESIADFFGFGNHSGFSGLAIYGGVIGALLCGFLMCKIRKVNVLDMFDIAAAGFLLGQGVGRWGNFFNQEAYGTFTGSDWWGMTSTRTVAEMGKGLVHPCFLYESIWCILGFFLLNYLSKNRKFKGEIALSYGIWYGFERGFLELIRTDSLMLGNIRVSSLLSFVLCAGCIIAMIIMLRRYKQNTAAATYTSVFESESTENADADEIKEEINENTDEIEKEIIEDGENN
ncbi:MAG: prolipoprotein diacylglyceryl transferase [Clostridiales bacterium]|nr:prolipoprotein diacylglyceryl transferase [Candidatus Equinaster intestinalis]